MSIYRKRIQAELIKRAEYEIDPRHIEACMRVEHPTLDGLSAEQFVEEVSIGIEFIYTIGPEKAEQIAQSYGI